MNALTKVSVALLGLAVAGAAYFSLTADEGGFEAVRSHPQDPICQQDGDRLARLRARPSLEEGLRLAGEIRCTQLWPQVQAILDGLSAPARSIAEANPTRASAIVSASDAAPQTVAPASDDPCKQDADHLAELKAKPTVDKAARLAGEFTCIKLLPQLLATLDTLRRAEEAGPPTGPTDAGIIPAGEAARPPSDPTAAPPTADAARRIKALESENQALAAEVASLQRNQEPISEPVAAPGSPQPAIPAERSEAQPASRGAADAKRSDSELGAALASLPEGMPARVLIRYLTNNASARTQAEDLANVLKKQGVEATDIRESRTAIRTELSFSYAPDEAIAQQVGRLVGVAPVRRLQAEDGLMVRPGAVELSLSGDSHSAAIIATSTRESGPE